MTELRVARGRKVVRVLLGEGRPPDDELLALLLGRSGKLRAPALQVGTIVVVGYNRDILESALGAGRESALGAGRG